MLNIRKALSVFKAQQHGTIIVYLIKMGEMKIDNLKDFVKKYPMLTSLLTPIYAVLTRTYLLFKYGVLILPKHKYHYNMAGLITCKNIDFMKEPKFINATMAGQELYESPEPNFNGWIRHLNLWAIYHAKLLNGDFVECGVWRAATAKANMVYIDFQNMDDRKYYLFDTFCGLTKEYSDSESYEMYKNDYKDDVYSFVVDVFKENHNVIIVRGPVPDTLTKVNIRRVAYLSIDMNCAFPEIEALKYFWPKIVPGGLIILDDYGWGGVHEKQKQAHDAFAESVGVKILTLPTGQGMIIKPPLL